jgi:hypothetical protein
VLAGIVTFEALAPNFFPTPPGGGHSLARTICAGIVGAISVGIGLGIRKLIDRQRE